VDKPSRLGFAQILTQLLEGQELDAGTVRALWQDMISGALGDAEIAALLVALRMKGETAGELAAAAGVVRENMVRLETGRDDLLDTCGMGGKGFGSVNISTAAAIVAAAAGAMVVKHGNRSVSSPCGSADVLSELGVAIDADVATAQRCLDACGLAFCLAPNFHPAWKRLGHVRKLLGVRTAFNLLGPLANPAGAAYQLLGVSRPVLLDPVAGALARLGSRHAVVVCAADGLDEVSLAATTQFREIKNGAVTRGQWTSTDFGLDQCEAGDLRVRDSKESAKKIRAVLDGEDGPIRRTVLANAGAALWVAERASTPAAGVAQGADAIASGRARRALEQLVLCSRGN
jgi:anthranilate phosphoribosyltransferase